MTADEYLRAVGPDATAKVGGGVDRRAVVLTCPVCSARPGEPCVIDHAQRGDSGGIYKMSPGDWIHRRRDPTPVQPLSREEAIYWMELKAELISWPPGER